MVGAATLFHFATTRGCDSLFSQQPDNLAIKDEMTEHVLVPSHTYGSCRLICLCQPREPSLRLRKVDPHGTEDSKPECCRREYRPPLKGWVWRQFAVVESGKECSQDDANDGGPLIEPQACEHFCLRFTVSAVNSALLRARARLRERLGSHKPAWPASVDASEAERDLLKKYIAASEAADFRAFESIIRADATFRMPPQPDTAAGREAMFRLWIEGGFGSEHSGHLRCVVTHANLQPAVANYVRRPGDSTWRAMALDVLRIEKGLITEIVTFVPDTFPLFGLPILMDAAPEMNTCH